MGAGNSLWVLIAQSDAMTKVVLLTLLGMSIACWTITLYKLLLARAKHKSLQAVMMRVAGAQSADDLARIASQYKHSLAGYFLHSILGIAQQHGNLVEGSEYCIDGILFREQAYLGMLSTSAALAPLMGLFGTVWGLVHAFIDISQKQAADISVVAPGIAEALITTLAGLLVAIPAAAFFYYLQGCIRQLEHELVALAQRITSIVQNNTQVVGGSFTKHAPSGVAVRAQEHE